MKRDIKFKPLRKISPKNEKSVPNCMIFLQQNSKENILKIGGKQTDLGASDIHFMNKNISQNIYVPTKKVIQVWNIMTVSKL